MSGISGINLKDLQGMGQPDLRRMWAQHFGTPVPPTMSPELLRMSIGYKLQEAMFGGLSRKVLLQLSANESGTGSRVFKASPSKATPKAGTKFIREWRSKVHEVSVLADGKFAYGDRSYKSLTVIAREITGTHQSGPKFFGLQAPAKLSADGRSSIG